jgi:Na+/melibiose symporter-like transporter
VAGGIVAFVIIGIIVFFFVWRSRKNRHEAPQPEVRSQGESVSPQKSPPASPTYGPSFSIEVQNAQFPPYVSFFVFFSWGGDGRLNVGCPSES